MNATNEIELSKDINVITAEINSYKQIAGQSIWEIGRRLLYVKEKNLLHGEFITWVNSLGMDRTEAVRFMKVAKELPNDETFHHLGSTALYLITQIPEEERTKEHETAKGELKTPDEMTTRELQQLKKKLKEQKQQLDSKNAQISSLSETVKELDKQPRVIEKEVEVVPIDYDTTKIENEQLIEQNKKLEQQYRDLLSERSKVDEKSEKYEQLSQAIKVAENNLNDKQKMISNYKKLSDLIEKSNDFLSVAGGLVYQDMSEVVSRDNLARREYEALIGRLERFLDNLRSVENIIIEGEVLDG